MSTQPAPTPDKSEARPDAGFKKTLHLPKTAFAMKANLVQNEPASVKRWESIGLYDALRKARSGAPRFVFHDGPPYANGSIHLGHLLNKCLKDIVVRSQSMLGASGQDVPYIPGWDCHGLPIEHKVMTELVESGKAAKLATLEPDARRMAVRKACQAYAEKYQSLQAGQMKRLLTLGDYAHPYMTMRPEYEAAVLETLADLIEQGLVYRALKPVHWSIANETALAEAELEYYDREDPSIYVEFEALDRAAVERAFNLDPDTLDRTPTFMIWTTTPWTLAANLAVAVHEKFVYALAEIDGSFTVIAEDLLAPVTRRAQADKVRVLATTTGDRLVGLRYRHPFVDAGALAQTLKSGATLHRVVAAPYVTAEDGTGLVHTAPGHGAEDHQTGLREQLPVYCPVKEDGRYDQTAPEWLRGKLIWDANKEVVEHLRASGHLFHDFVFTHSYPHDWRGKTPVIFRATEQWFIGVDRPRSNGQSLRDLALDVVVPANETVVPARGGLPEVHPGHVAFEHHVQFYPEWGRNRLRGMLESRPDWCISRQRAWGLPIPAFSGPDGATLLTPASCRAVVKSVRERGSDAWFKETPAQLLAGYEPSKDKAAPAGLDVATLVKGGDILDVWFESGCSWNAVMRQRGRAEGHEDYPVDLYLEGSDQHRGWFQVSLLTALGSTGQAPFKALLTHGFIVDKDGKKMSKSLGNTLEVEDLLKEYGADVCRWWVATLAFENDIKVDKSYIEAAGEAYRKVRNTLRFMLSNLFDFTEGSAPKQQFDPLGLDAWALGEFDTLSARVRDAYNRYDFRAASSAIYDFCNDALSAVYLNACKDRLYCDRADSPRRRRTQAALWRLTDGLCRLLAPILPHTADEAWRSLRWTGKEGAPPDDLCVHTGVYVESLGVTPDVRWANVLTARQQALLALERERARAGGVENPIDAGLTLPDPEGALAAFNPVDLADLLSVSRVTLDRGASEPRVTDLRAEPRCERSWRRDGTVRARSNGSLLSDRDAEALGL